ncbi:MAG TPA: ThuA domain-containing protein [Verrucomicrobiae bacterium]|nr:ThuA domain-containing protein [Verrucomicrobiae bacterium]
MGHGPWLFEDKAYTTLLRNAILWAAETPSQTNSFKMMAFYPAKTEEAHMSFVREADLWFAKAATTNHFTYTSTTNWDDLNDQTLAQCQVVAFLDARPETPSQRAAFRRYMEAGGGWIGFHFAGFALTPSEFPQNWDWYHEEFLGCGSYVGNTWKPTSAILRVEDHDHPATRYLPETFRSAPNEWYKWSNDLRTNANIDILLSIDPASYPLGTGPKPNEIWHQGYYPVVWTNKRYRMVYFNMGHNDIDGKKQVSSTFDSEPQNRFLLNTLLWLGRGKK